MQFGDFCLIGFACDEGVRRNHGRPGADKGPESFRQVLPKLNFTLNDLGDIACDAGNLEAAQEKLGQKVFEVLSKGRIPVVVGGGHETAWGHFQGISRFLGEKNCGVINFDAHFDLRPLLEGGLGSSGTSFLQIAQERAAKNLKFEYLVLGIQPFSNSPVLFEIAKKLEVSYVLAENFDKQAEFQIDAMLARHEYIYLSICLDVFAECFAPGVSAPQALGLMPMQVLPLIQKIKQSKKLLAVDIAELAPAYDRQQTTAKLAASLVGYLV